MTREELFEKFFTKDENGHTIGSFGGWYILPDGRIVDHAEFSLWLSENKEKYMTEQEIRDRISELKKPEIERENEIRRLQKEVRKIEKEKLRSLVGRCYKHKTLDKIFIITGVPQEKFMKTGNCLFDPYLLPARVITNQRVKSGFGLKPLSAYEVIDTTIFSRAVEATDPVASMAKEYDELTIEEFRAAAYKTIDELIETCTESKEN